VGAYEQSPPSSLTYEAESASLTGAVVAKSHAGYKGSGFVDYLNASGDAVEFAVQAPSAGWYDLSFRYANGGTSDRPLEMSVDDQVLPGRVSFPPTGNWRIWQTASQPVALAAGRHTVRLTAVGRSGPNLDALTVLPSGTARFDPAAQFSGDQNPSGVWRYGYSAVLAGPLTLYDRVEVADGAVRWSSSSIGIDPNVSYNPTSHDAVVASTVTLRPGDLVFHLGPQGQWSHFLFRAPSPGTYAASGFFGGPDVLGTTTDVRVRINASDVFAGVVNGTRGAVVPFSVPFRVLNAGDTIDFAVGVGADGSHADDSTLLSATITATV